ncbi:MAG TPA: TonB-dependent receptor [Bacteroidia bacterium]|nr:TonB-dependent receptor [Bacteroidia bacterium]
MNKKCPLFYFLVIAFSSYSLAQTKSNYTISGYISEKGSKENLPGVNIYIPKLKTGTTTNTYGFYSITLPSDSVELVVSFVGFQTQHFKFFLDSNKPLDISLEISQLQEVVVTDTKTERISKDVQMSKIDIPIEQIKNMPTLLGEKDVMKTIQLLPGVQKGSEGSSGIYVRGGGPDQNLIILDDAPVYNANHLFGFFSLFNGDALKSVELTKGGFPARYGGRLSSVIDMQMKDGDKEKIKGEAGIGLLSSRLTLEGPIKKDKASFLFSARRTYLDLLIRPFISGKDDAKAGYYFYDFNAKLNYVIDYKNKLYLSGYFGKDKFYIQESKPDAQKGLTNRGGIDWGNATGTLRWNHLINEKLFSNVSLIFTNFLFDIHFQNKDQNNNSQFRYFSGIRDYSLKADFDYFLNTKHTIKAGLNATYHFFRPDAVVLKDSYQGNDNLNISNTTKINTYETAVYVEDDYKITTRWRANAGFRLSNFNVRSKSYFNPEPRLSLRYALRSDLSLKASYATMNQYIHLLSNSGIGLPSDLWVPSTDKVKPQHSSQVALGIAKDLKLKDADFEISVEGYYKKSKNIIGYKEGASFINVSSFSNGEEYKFSYEDVVTAGKAESYGAEFFVQKKSGKFTGWIGYTLSWTWLQFDELNFGKRFHARYDRRHDISVVGTYKLTDRITLSAVWVYGTGNAITLPLSTFNIPTNPHANDNTGGYQNTIASDYGDKNSFRMSAYHRLDIGIQFHKQKKHYERIFELGVYNAYNRHNAFYYYTRYDDNTQQTKLTQVSLFPVIPSVSWTFKF